MQTYNVQIVREFELELQANSKEEALAQAQALFDAHNTQTIYVDTVED